MKKLFFAVSLFAAFAVTSCEQEQELNSSIAPEVELLNEEARLLSNASANFAGRIAISADGNYSDRDDIGATPIGLAMMAHAGLRNQLVHYDYNSHIWGNGPDNQKKDMTESTLEGATRFGFDQNLFISAIDDPKRAEQSIATAINQSSASNPLYFIVAGPMGVACEGIRLSNPEKRKYVYVISHSEVNNDYTSNGSCTADGIKQTGVKFVQISDQNKGFFVDWKRWEWLRKNDDDNLRWIHERMMVANKPDVSDAGMIWYLLKNDENGNPEKLKAFFEGNPSPNPGPDKDPKPDKEPKPDKDPKPGNEPKPDTDNCVATGSTLEEAKKNLEQLCGVTYDKGNGHDCDPDGQGGWICSTGKVKSGGKDNQPGGNNPGGNNPDPDNGNCESSGNTLEEAISNLEKACGVTYDKAKGHDCDPDGKGGWNCSTGDI